MVARFLALLATIFGSSLLITTIYAVSCGPGTFVNSTLTGCQRCPNGTFSNQRNSASCYECKTCAGKHDRISQHCTSTMNTKCECESGYYFGPALICLKCAMCKRGMGLKRNCTATGNTVCEQCEKGKTFSSGKNFERCKPCSRCQKGEIVKEECTRRRDTKCTPERDINGSKRVFTVPPKTTAARPATAAARNTRIPTRKKPLKSTSKPSSTLATRLPSATSLLQQEDDNDSDSKEEQFRIILFVLVGLLVAIVLAVVVFYVWKRLRRPVKMGKPDTAEEPSTRTNSTEVIGAVENPYSSLPFIGGRQGGEKMLREVPYTLITDLSQFLNPNERWKQLGGRLHFNSTQINNFAVEGGKATEAMLQEWSQRDSATVVALKHTFKSMKWSKEERLVAAYV